MCARAMRQGGFVPRCLGAPPPWDAHVLLGWVIVPDASFSPPNNRRHHSACGTVLCLCLLFANSIASSMEEGILSQRFLRTSITPKSRPQPVLFAVACYRVCTRHTQDGRLKSWRPKGQQHLFFSVQNPGSSWLEVASALTRSGNLSNHI